MIGEDSTCGARPGSPTSTGQVPALRHSAAAARSRLGRIGQRHELAAVARGGSCAPSRTSAAAPPRGRRRRRAWCSRCAPSGGGAPVRASRRPTATAPSQRPPAAQQRARNPARAVAQLLALAPAGTSIATCGRTELREGAAVMVTSRSVASSQDTWCSSPTASSSTGSRPCSPGAGDVARDDVQEPHADVQRGTPRRPPAGTGSASRRRRPGCRSAVRLGVDAAERPAALVLGGRAASTATARSPRRARRRRSCETRPGLLLRLVRPAASRARAPSSASCCGRGTRRGGRRCPGQPQPGGAREVVVHRLAPHARPAARTRPPAPS